MSVTQEAEIAGGVAALLLVAVGGLAAARRRRHDPADLAETPLATEPMRIAREPVRAPTPVRTPTRIAAPGLPAGFDLSRFGPHVQAAYRGPTKDNPSLSLKKRLHRAAALDQRERMAADNNEQIVHRPTSARRGLFAPHWSLQRQG